MSLVAPTRRLVAQCLFSTPLPIRSRLPAASRLASTSDPKSFRRPRKSGQKSNPVLARFLKENPDQAKPQPILSPEQQAIQQREQIRKNPGDISTTSIFEDEKRAEELVKRANEEKAPAAAEEEELEAAEDEAETGRARRDRANTLRALDPDPSARERWQRKRIIQQVRRGGRLSRDALRLRTEREHLAKSVNFKTSVKKLGMLARQIAGKTLDDAITQMRFSKKAMAVEVRKQLEAARDEAIVMRGMGLGGVADASTAAASPEDATAPEPDAAIDIQLKNGRRHTVTDRREIYIDQAWVGRGPYGKLPDYRARGRVFIMRTPWTSLSLLLKEEATRVREWEEREAKRRRKRVDNIWVQLPDRPIQARHQWYSW